MSPALQKAVVQENLDLSHQFRENSAMRNGLPTRPARNIVEDEPRAKPTVAGLMRRRSPPATEPVATPQVIEKVPNWIKASLVAATLGAGGVGGALLAGLRELPSTLPASSVTERQEPPPTAGDLLRWLSREGYDRPPTPGTAP